VLGSSSSGGRFYVHAADKISHSYCGIHYDLPRFHIEGSNGGAVLLSKSDHSRRAAACTLWKGCLPPPPRRAPKLYFAGQYGRKEKRNLEATTVSVAAQET
jgi:hypothetical protein